RDVPSDHWTPAHEVLAPNGAPESRCQIHTAGFATPRIRHAGFCVDRDQVGVVRAGENPFGVAVAPIRQTPVNEPRVSRLSVLVDLRVVHPPRLARARI